MACPHSESCPLYPQFSLDTLLKYWKTSYCEADYARCARYKLSQQGEPVPLTLLPSGRMMGPKAAQAAGKLGGDCG